MSLDPAALRSVADALTDLAAAIRNALDEPEAKPDARQGPETTYRDAHDTFGTRRGVVRADIPESGGQPEHHCDEPRTLTPGWTWHCGECGRTLIGAQP